MALLRTLLRIFQREPYFRFSLPDSLPLARAFRRVVRKKNSDEKMNSGDILELYWKQFWVRKSSDIGGVRLQGIVRSDGYAAAVVRVSK